MIDVKDLRNGLIVRARRARGNMHKEFSIWKVSKTNLWMRLGMDFGEIAGRKDTTGLLRYLNRYEFEIVGAWEAKFYHDNVSQEVEQFNLDGAL